MDGVPVTVPIVDYPVHTRTLGNGMRVIVSPDHSVPMVAVNLWYDVGSRDERPGQTGWAHLFEHLMFQGSAHVASGEHLNALQAVGGSVNATTWFDRTNYFETVPTGALDLALWMEADRLATLADNLTQDNLDTQREVVKEEKRQRYDNVPYGDVIERLVTLVFGPDHPYGHTTIGSMADLDGATPTAAAAFFAAHYRPDNAVLTLVGDVEPRDGFRRAERFFGRIPGWNPQVRRPDVELPPLTGIPHVETAGAVPAEAIYFAWRLPPRDTLGFDSTDLALAILGQGRTARLHRRLVRQDRVADAAGSSALGLIGGNSIGFAHARALDGTAPDVLADLLSEEAARLADDGPSPSEVARAKAQYQREWLSEVSRLDARADLFGAYATLHADPGRVNRRLAEIEAVTAADIVTACRSFLRPEQRAMLTYHKEAAGAHA